MTEEAPEITFGKNMAALLADIRESQAIGLVVDQAYVNRLAQRHGVDAPVLTAAEVAKAQAAASELEAKAKEVGDIQSTMEQAVDYARRNRAFLGEARACFYAGTPLDQRFVDELADRWGVLHPSAETDPVVTASQREAQLAVLAREITEIQTDETGITASELAACKATGCTPENFLALRRAQHA